jgi:hypothetical protein
MNSNQAIAGGILAGTQKLGGWMGTVSGRYHDLNMLALNHHYNSMAMQQAHEHNMAREDRAHSNNVEMATLKHGLEHQSKQADWAREDKVGAKNRTHEIRVKNLESKNRMAEESTKHNQNLSVLQHAATIAEPGTRVKSGSTEFTTRTTPVSPSQARTNTKSRMRQARAKGRF